MATQPSPLPRHIAIVMDGNGRWAQQRGLKRNEGHKAGVKALRERVSQCRALGISVLTVFAFSSENWRRPKLEVNLLMRLFMEALRKEAKSLAENGVRLRILGDRSAFPKGLQKQMAEAEAITAEADAMLLQVAANYGGRWDIVQSVRQLAEAVREGGLNPADIDEERLAARLSFADQPDPDLFIRTGGEQRLSNFLLWQSAYAELYFSDALWPDFDDRALADALTISSHKKKDLPRVVLSWAPHPRARGGRNF